MAYIVNGKVVERKPFSIVAVLLSIVNAIRLFILTIFSSQTVDKHCDDYKASKYGRYSGGGPNIKGIAKPAAMGGCAGGG